MGNKIDVLIKDGLIFDGTASDPFISDIGITGDRIMFIRPAGSHDAGIIIPAKGLTVSPGFIDTHAHSDFTMLADPRAEGKLFQGITTEINGNCGMSAAPLFGKVFEKREADLRELGIRERWSTLTEYFALLEQKGPALNFALLTGHGNIRGSVVGYDDLTPSAGEIDRMSVLLRESLDAGALGFSTGLIYPPGVFAGTEELIELAKNLSRRSLIYTSHMRSEGNALLEAIEEVMKIAKEAGVKVHISHIKTAGEKNWHKADKAVSLMRSAEMNGLKITCDRYPYIASSTDLDALLPSWVFEGGDEKELARLQDVETKIRIRKELEDEIDSASYWDKIIVSSVASDSNRWMEGRTVAEISTTLKINGLDAVIRILVDERLRAGAIFKSMSEINLRKFLLLQNCMIGSDSSARCFDGVTRKGMPHPRGFGTFPRFLGKYVRDEQIMKIQDALHKITMLPARTFGLKGRGVLKEGMYADIAIFDYEKMIDHATFENPFQKPSGMTYVLVNGVPAVWEGLLTGKRNGRVLRSA